MSDAEVGDRNHVTPPPPKVTPNPQLVTYLAGTQLLRIYDPQWSPDEIFFRHWGPRLRFDHHRAPLAQPETDEERAIWYGAPLIQASDEIEGLEVCLWECFGERRRIDPGCFLGRIRVADGHELKLLNLVDKGAIEAGTIAQIAATPDPALSQEWSRYFYENPMLYDEIDGLFYRSSWIGGINVALYERGAAKVESRPELASLRFTEGGLGYRIARFADRYGFSLSCAEL